MTSAIHMTTLLLTAGATVLFAPSASADEAPDATAIEQDAAYRQALASPRRHESHLRLELEGHAGRAFPSAEEGLRPGMTAGLAVLFRPFSAWGVGAVYDRYWFDWLAQAPGFDDPAATSSMRVFGFANRLYVLDRGGFDPYVQVMLGWARVDSSVKSGQCSDADGPLPELAVGFDVYVAHWIRLAPSVSVTTGPMSTLSCNLMYIPNEPPPEPATAMMAGLRLGGTFVFGDRRRP